MNPDQMRNRIDLNSKWAAVSYYVPSDQQVSVLETSLSYAEGVQDQSRAVKVMLWIGRMHHIRGNYLQAQLLPTNL